MSYTLDQDVFVVDKTDKKYYPCKVVEVDDNKKEVKIHFVSWSSRNDEWLPFISPRISLQKPDKAVIEDLSETDEPFLDSQEQSWRAGDLDVGTAIGKLLRSVDTESKSVISTYDVRLSTAANIKNFTKFQVARLDKCAANIKVKTKTDEGKKIYGKNALIKAILTRIEAHFPQTCGECDARYGLDLNETPLFSCYHCTKPSHNCRTFQDWKSLMPSKSPLGFVWFCAACFEAPAFQDDSTSTTVASQDDDKEKQEQESVPLSNQSKTELSTVPPNNIVSPNKIVPPNKSVCKHYLRKECKHGRRGQDCNYAHPKLCFNFIKRGDRPGGCNKGKRCTYLHPPMCRNRGVCDREKCRFYHLKGTKPSTSEQQMRQNLVTERSQAGSRQQIPRNQRRNEPSSPPMQYDNGNSSVPSRESTWVAPQDTGGQIRSQDFLEMKAQMKLIQDQLQWLLTCMRVAPPPAPRTMGWPPAQFQQQ